MSEKSDEAKEKLQKQAVDLRPFSYSMVAFVILAIFLLMFYVWKEVNDRGLINCGAKRLVAEHFWGGDVKNDVKVSWLIHRSDLIKDIKGVKSIQLFIKANVSNLDLKQHLSVYSIDLFFLPKSGVILSSHGVILSSHSEKLGWDNATMNESKDLGDTREYRPRAGNGGLLERFGTSKAKDAIAGGLLAELRSFEGKSLQIKPGQSKEYTFNYWVPVKIYEEIISLSATMRYELSD